MFTDALFEVDSGMACLGTGNVLVWFLLNLSSQTFIRDF